MKTIIKIILILITLNKLNAGVPVELNKKFIKFKDTKQGIQLTNNSIIIKNISADGLDFDLGSYCPCLGVSTEKDFLFPDEEIKIHLTFDTTKYEGITKKEFYIKYKDQGEKTITLYVIMNVISTNKQKKVIVQTSNKTGEEYKKELSFYFFEDPNCRECDKIKNELIPDLEKRYKVNLKPIYLDYASTNNFNKLRKVRTYLNIKDKGFPVILFDSRYIAGIKNIHDKLPQLVKKYHDKKIKLLDLDKLDTKQVKVSLSLIPVIFAGLLDGINPCAFATIIFLISYLSYLKKSKRTILLTGIFYTSSVFITYLLIGLGFLKGITAIPAFHKIAFYINIIIAFFTFFLAFLSLKDYLLARKGRFNEMALQLPDSFKKRIHKNIREQSKSRMIIFSAVLLGFTVSLIELACTGQIYLPTIIYLTKTGSITGYIYLIIYNIMFILPLVLIFYLYLTGVSSEKIADVFKKNVPLIKLLTFILFILLGALLLLSKVF